jgi:hypothetical protein
MLQRAHDGVLQAVGSEEESIESSGKGGRSIDGKWN